MNNDNFILNGRVNLYEPSSTQPTVKIPNNHPALYNPNNLQSISRVYSGTTVSEIFFSSANINLIQQGIINSVFNRSNGEYQIGKQNEIELNIIMRSYYLEKSKNLTYNIREQIKELNTYVIDWCTNEIITNIKQYLEYKRNVSTLKMPMENPLLTSQKGLKTLELNYF
jgi:hypothetical protein